MQDYADKKQGNLSSKVKKDTSKILTDNNSAVQHLGNSTEVMHQQPIQRAENNTGLPDSLKTGVESLSGYSLNDVSVHYNSQKPAQLNAHAYAQGTDIHVAPGQEKHLPHEAWHVVQQKQGRVKPTMQMKGEINVNDDAGLEKEADMMGDKALTMNQQQNTQLKKSSPDNGLVIQRVTLAVGELQEFSHKKISLSEEEHAHAKIITDAEENYRNSSKEGQVHPWEERNRLLLNFGPLKNIGKENLRIYGHGQVYVGDLSVSKIGGYSAQELSKKLIELGLPSSYTGEIYLTGCETAVGYNKGFLGVFYQLISKHCKGVTVRGNLDVTITQKDGVQGVWTGVISKDLFENTRDALVTKKDFYMGKNKVARVRATKLGVMSHAIKEELEQLLSGTPPKAEVDEFLAKQEKFSEACKAHEAAVKEINEYVNMITKAIKELDDIAYDRSGRLSVTLPADLNEQVNITGAIDDAKKIEEFRLTKLEIVEQLASIYGWAESVVTKKVYGGELNERAKSRIAAKSESTPSYIN